MLPPEKRPLQRKAPGKAQYTLCCDDATGGIVDDLIVYLRGEDEVFLGRREVPYPLDEGDSWTNQFGDRFRVENDEIVRLERGIEEPAE